MKRRHATKMVIAIFCIFFTASFTYAQQPPKYPSKKNSPIIHKPQVKNPTYPTPPPPPPPPVLTVETGTNSTAAQMESFRKTAMEYNVTMKFLAEGTLLDGNPDNDFATILKLSYQQVQKLALHEKVWSKKDSTKAVAIKIADLKLAKEIEGFKLNAAKATANNDSFKQAAMRLISETINETDPLKNGQTNLEKQMDGQLKLIKEVSTAYLKAGTDPVLISFAKKAIAETSVLTK